MLTGAVGCITKADAANDVVAQGKADLVFVGRELLRNPYWSVALRCFTQRAFVAGVWWSDSERVLFSVRAFSWPMTW